MKAVFIEFDFREKFQHSAQNTNKTSTCFGLFP